MVGGEGGRRKGEVGVGVFVSAGGAADADGVSSGVEVIVILGAAVDLADESEAVGEVGDERARAGVFANDRSDTGGIVEVLRGLAAGGGCDAFAEGVVGIGGGARGVGDAGELVQGVVGVGAGAVAEEVSVGVVVEGAAADAGVLVHVVGGVGGGDAVDDGGDAVSVGVVGVGRRFWLAMLMLVEAKTAWVSWPSAS